MIGKLEEGRSLTRAAEEFGIKKNVVSRSWKTTAVDDRHIVLQTKRARYQSVSANAQQLCIATGREVSRFTVAKRLHKSSPFARCSERCIPLKVGHRRHCLEWCKEHKNWISHQWSRVPSTDESRFSATSDSQRQLTGTRFHLSNIMERDHYGGPGIVVRKCIMLNGWTELHVYDKGYVTGDFYCKEVIFPYVRLIRVAIRPDFVFIDDNARNHRTRVECFGGDALRPDFILREHPTTETDAD
ncbi:transposable element Tcb2 transposase [Trichonephila clavipes]|nr:transposable element Tcb2 transposase [Trichonephila clavipes]